MDLLKGTLDVLILKTLSWRPLHGYGIGRALRIQTDEVFDVEEGALYPALRRLEARGLLDASWSKTDTGRDAKFYRLTSDGEEELQREMSRWERYVEAMFRVLGAEALPGD